jgi:hypothetical protein
MTAGSGSLALTEQMLTIDPRPASSIIGTTALVVRTAERRFSPIVAFHSSSVTVRNPPVRAGALPTLFTRMSIGRPAKSISRDGPSGDARSISMMRSRPVSASDFSSGVVVRAAATTAAPVLKEPASDLEPYALAGAGDYRRLALQPEVHNALLFCFESDNDKAVIALFAS